MRNLLESLQRIFFPEFCRLCGRPLAGGEHCVCRHCNVRLARTRFHLNPDNPAAQCFWGKVDIERVACFGYYRDGGRLRDIVHHFKYHHAPRTAYQMGLLYARELMYSGWHSGVDLLIPVPLHPLRELLRGYNQSEELARGVADVWSIPVETGVLRKQRHNASQTRRSHEERYANTLGAFVARHPERVEGRHVVLIDDVLTTGSTLEACAHALHDVANVRISILTIGFAGLGPGG